jgi:hypothetical protein
MARHFGTRLERYRSGREILAQSVKAVPINVCAAIKNLPVAFNAP